MTYATILSELALGAIKLTLALYQLSQPTALVYTQGYALYTAALSRDTVSACKAGFALYKAVSSLSACIKKQMTTESSTENNIVSSEATNKIEPNSAEFNITESNNEVTTPDLNETQPTQPSSWFGYLSAITNRMSRIPA